MRKEKKHMTIEERLIGQLMKKGKKSIALKIYAETLELIRQKAKDDPKKVVEKAIENAMPFLELRAKRIGGAVYQIPMEVKPNRQITLGIRWILNAARSKKGKNMPQRLSNELLLAYDNQGDAVKKKDDTHKMAEANKAFAHFARM